MSLGREKSVNKTGKMLRETHSYKYIFYPHFKKISNIFF